MWCTQCKTQFCYLCLRTYDAIRQDGHGPACVYARPGALDPHLVAHQAILGGAAVLAFAAGVGFFGRR